MDDAAQKSVGLGGDGDELYAIEDVERAFGVKLDYLDAPHWRTAGDLFSSLCKVLPAGVQSESALWARFTEALLVQTGVDPANIEKDSPLLLESRPWVQLAHASAVVWTAAAASLMALVAWALL